MSDSGIEDSARLSDEEQDNLMEGLDVEEEDKQESLAKLTRPELLKKITDIWVKKKDHNSDLLRLSDDIDKKKDQIKEIKTKMAIESNDLNVIGDEIRKIETKIKELTSVGK